MIEETARPLAFVALGGTGIIGSALRGILEKRGIACIAVSLDKSENVGMFQNIQIDLKSSEPISLANLLYEIGEKFDVAGVLDIIGVRGPNAQCIADFVKKHNIGLGIISSCLLYEHSPDDIVHEAFPTISEADAAHPYHIEKLKVESFWKQSDVQNCLLFRTHHILGRGALLGCIPNHNRDPFLLEHLKKSGGLALSNRGNVRFSYIHPEDLATIALELILDQNMQSGTINLVHPEPALARTYFQNICAKLGVPIPEIEDFQADPKLFWSTTAKDNVFRSNNTFVQSFSFKYGIDDCIDDALSIGSKKYTELGAHMMKRISGQG